MAKRKAGVDTLPPATKKGKSSAPDSLVDVKTAFRDGLFDASLLSSYHQSYFSSGPYRHTVINRLMNDDLLWSVKQEILANLHFTPKETDIYRIHQTGDLANLSGLPENLQSKLSSLRKLRDALYSQTFRNYVSGITGCGALSGSKTDMAINVYTPGCHLLTHDDVIGSRRVSYILYLTGSPEKDWNPERGGSLRLYPCTEANDGTKVPLDTWSKVIPPSWNQLSFFEVVPGESFHDVEEVYDGPDWADTTRMAISGWFHIPQKGEDGYVEGLEEELAKSSLQSLQSKADDYDRPQPNVVLYENQSGTAGKGKEKEVVVDEESFSPEELDFLLKYISPTYLTPDTLEQLADAFAEDSSVQITSFLRDPFASSLRAYIEAQDSLSSTWLVAVPPHKQKFAYLQTVANDGELTPIEDLLRNLFPSKEFHKLLQMATGVKLVDHDLLARRFRRGLDYTLATEFGGDNDMRLEICLGLTPSQGWGSDDLGDGADDENGNADADGDILLPAANSSEATPPPPPPPKKPSDFPVPAKASKFRDEERTVGGYEMYMSSSEGDDKKADPAIYQAAADEDEDDGVLFMNPAAWNTLSVVLRDKGILRFVKYVSKAAKGDRWDIVGGFGVAEDKDDGED